MAVLIREFNDSAFEPLRFGFASSVCRCSDPVALRVRLARSVVLVTIIRATLLVTNRVGEPPLSGVVRPEKVIAVRAPR